MLQVNYNVNFTYIIIYYKDLFERRKTHFIVANIQDNK